MKNRWFYSFKEATRTLQATLKTQRHICFFLIFGVSHSVNITEFITNIRSSLPEKFCKKGVLRNFAKFTGKHLYQILFLNKVAGLACNFIKKESLAQVLSCEFCEFSKNTFFYRTPQVAASKITVFKKIRDSLTNFTFSF